MTTPRLPPPTISGLSASDGIVALLDGGVEGVAIDMCERQHADLGMADEARRAAGPAARRPAARRQAVAAEAGRHGTSRSCEQAARGASLRALDDRADRLCLRGEGEQAAFVVRRDVVQHAGQELRLARGGANVAGSDAGCSKETAQPLRIRRNEAKRLYCQGFRGFARGL